MLLNYLKLSLRLLVRNPFYTFINVLGLSVGFASFFALWQYASSELKADQYHPNHDRIARLGVHWRWTDDNGKSWGYIKGSIFGLKVVQEIARDFPEVESYVRIVFPTDFIEGNLFGHGSQIVLSAEHKDGSTAVFRETKAAYADANLFDFFSIPLRYGNRTSLLKDPNTIVLSETTARKYFGNENPVGKLLILNGLTALKVTGVFEDLPTNTHLRFDFVLSNASTLDRWNATVFPCAQCYVRLKPGVEFEEFEKKIGARNLTYWAELLKTRTEIKIAMWVQPLDEVAFSNNYHGDYFDPKSKSTLVLFSAVAILVLLMAWVNYINLTLARASRRMKEVATRKMSGAQTIDFVKHFLTESILINLISLAVACTMLQLVRVPAELMLKLPIGTISAMSLESIGFFTSVVLIGIIVTGLYPALMAVRHNPRKLISINAGKSRSNLLPGILTTFQYASATVLLLCVVVVYFQLSFIFGKGFGVGKDPTAIIESPILRSNQFNAEIEYFKNQLISQGFALDATYSKTMVGDDRGVGNLLVRKSDDGAALFLTSQGGVGENFIKFFGIPLLAGRNFAVGDKNVILISQVGLRRLGFDKPEDALGQKIQTTDDEGDTLINSWKEIEIIGVIKDYNTKLFFNNGENDSEYRGHGICLTYNDVLSNLEKPERLAIRLDLKNLVEIIPKIESLFKETFPGNPFVLYFQDDHINRHYNNEKTSRNQIVFFTLLAIGIACLGLLGMISNKLAEKTKEIGVRKVLGARMHHIAQVLLHSTLKQVVIANVISIPLAYYLTQQYLEKFSERISPQWWYYAIPIIILLGLMFATIASILFKAVRTNPVESLRYE